MYLVCFDANFTLFVSFNNVLLLSWCNTLGPKSYPWHSRKYLVHDICGNASSMAMMLLFWAFSIDFLSSQQCDGHAFAKCHVCTCMAFTFIVDCMPVSSHYFTTGMVSASSHNPIFGVPCRYFNSFLSFPQSSSSGFLVLWQEKPQEYGYLYLLSLTNK